MFCTKCGKELQEGDRFCAYCGAEARNRMPSKNDEVVFNPPFKIEAQKKTEEILRATEERKEQEKAKRESVSFGWNLEGFPKESSRKTEDVDFNWDSVLDRRNRYNSGSVGDEIFEPKYEPVNESLQRRERERIRQIEEADTERKVRMPQPIDEGSSFNWNVDDYRFRKEKQEFGDPLTLTETPAYAHEEEKPLSPEELEKELFDEMSPKGDDRFKTFNSKNSEFQALLDKEKERVKSLEDEYNRQFAEMDYTWVPDVFPEMTRKEVEKKNEPEAGTQITQKKAAEPDTQPEKLEEEAILIGVVQPATPHTVDLSEVAEAAKASEAPSEEAPETERPSEAAPERALEEQDLPFRDNEEPKSGGAPSDKTKLRYSDIFPRVDNQGGGNDNAADAGDHKNKELDAYREEEPVRKHTFLKVLLAILIIAIIVEGVILGIKFFAPDSKLSQTVDDVVFKAVDLFSGIGSGDTTDISGDEGQGTDADVESAYMSNLVTEKSADAETIGTVTYNPDLRYADGAAYSFEEIATADKFVDAEWEDMNATYGQKLIEAIVKYYDGWLGTNTDEKLVGINTLEIGEIRSGQSGFYTLCKVTYAGSDGNEVTEVQTVFASISNQMIVINEVKEESV